MPVYERGYRHWEPSGRREAAPWWVIARRGILAPLRTRRFLALLLLAWVPAVVKGVILYFSFQAGDLMKLLGGSWASVDAPGFFAFLEKQRGFVLIVLAIIGTPLVARDRSENGLALYFARPLTLRDYVLGKLLIVLFYFLIVTLAPVLLLALFGYLVTSGATGLDMLLLTPLRATIYCLLAGTSLGLVLLALSAAGRRTVFIAMSWLLLFAGSALVAQILTLFGGPWMKLLDVPAQYDHAGSLLFGAKAPLEYPRLISCLLIAGYTAGAWVVLRRRIRPVEVVS